MGQSPAQQHQGVQPQAQAQPKTFQTGRFGANTMQQKRDAAIAALRAEREVSEPKREPPVQGVRETLSTTDQVEKIHQMPNSVENQVAGMTDSQVRDILAAYDKKIQEQRTLEQQNAARAAEIQAQQQQAAEKLKKLEQAKTDPLEFLAQAGISDDEWKQFLKGGGDLSPEQKQLKELRAQLEQMQSRYEQDKQQTARQAALAEAAQHVSTHPLMKMMATPQSILQVQEAMSKQQGRQVSVAEASQNLLTSFKSGVMNVLKSPDVLQDPEIAAILSQGVPKPQTGQADYSPPSTLSSKLASSTDPSAEQPGPLDWAAKRAKFLRLVAQQRGG